MYKRADLHTLHSRVKTPMHKYSVSETQYIVYPHITYVNLVLDPTELLVSPLISKTNNLKDRSSGTFLTPKQ